MKISKRERTFIVICIISVVLFSLTRFVILPFVEDRKEVEDNISTKEMTYKKYIAFIAKKKEVEKDLALLRDKEKNLDAKLLKGDTPSLAASDLQQILTQVSVQAKTMIQSTKVMEAEPLSGGFLSVPIQVKLVSDISRSRRFVAMIEDQTKYLTIPELRISVLNKADPKEVVVTMVVSGFMKGAPPEPEAEKPGKMKNRPIPHPEAKPKKLGG